MKKSLTPRITCAAATLFVTWVIAAGTATDVRAGSPPPNEVIHQMIDAISLDSLHRHIQVLEDAGGTRSRIAFTPGKDSAAVYIKDVFDRMPGLSSVHYDTFYVEAAQPPYNTIPQVNVVATIEGSVYPDSYYIIGGHYDSTSDRDDNWNNGADWQTMEAPGANDNGTGVAAVLEIARVLSDPDTGFRPDYTLVFVAFGVEERIPASIRSGSGNANHVGSRHFATRASSNNDDIRGMISIDMIGYNNHHEYTALVMHENFMVDESVQFGTKLYFANLDFDIGLTMNSPAFARGAYSDHDTFADEGYPAVLVIENAPPWRNNTDNNNTPYLYYANPYYHKTTDTREKINMPLVTKVAQLNLAAIAYFGGYVETSTGDPDPEQPLEIILVGNHPNPFNPSTNIVFELAHSSHVELAVYDLTGSRIDVLVDATMPAGRHSIPFDAAAGGRSLASGIYLYRLSSGTLSATGKMLLVK
ncbi:MAG: M20/M25/M40 family metallo-hydrolase [Cyclonatronaceae bacterium]